MSNADIFSCSLPANYDRFLGPYFKEAYRVISKEGKFVFNTWGPLNDSRRSGIIKDVMEDCFKDDAPGFLTKGPTLSILPMLSNPY